MSAPFQSRFAVLSLLLLSVCVAGIGAVAAIERIIFVEPPLRLLTQCQLREINAVELTCIWEGSPRKVALGTRAGAWKGRDYPDASALRPGDWLDIKLGLDSQSREVAKFIWANLVSVEGVVRGQAAPGWVQVRPLVLFSIGEVGPEPVFAAIDASTDFVGGAGARDLQQGRAVIVIGERLDDRRVRASRIVLAKP